MACFGQITKSKGIWYNKRLRNPDSIHISAAGTSDLLTFLPYLIYKHNSVSNIVPQLISISHGNYSWIELHFTAPTHHLPHSCSSWNMHLRRCGRPQDAWLHCNKSCLTWSAVWDIMEPENFPTLPLAVPKSQRATARLTCPWTGHQIPGNLLRGYRPISRLGHRRPRGRAN